MVLTPAEKSARYRAKDIEAYRAKKNALAKEPHHKAVRAAYAKKWRDARVMLPRKPRPRKYTDEQIKERKRLAMAKWRAENPELHRANSRRTYHKYKDRYKAKLRDSLLRRKYGISSADFDRMLIEQGSKCAICSGLTPRHSSNWHTDHCHVTGKVRGILCHVCNTKLGWYELNREAIIRYLG